MSEMSIALAANNFSALHAMALISVFNYACGIERVPEAGPPTTRIELRT